MIFTGDISIPFKGVFSTSNIPDTFVKKTIIGNLEGSVVDNSDAIISIQERKVFNHIDAIKDLCKSINFRAFNIANNHILNVCSIKDSEEKLKSIGISCVGGGIKNEAKKEILIEDETGEYAIVAFGWNVIDCIYAEDNKEGVNPYTKKNVLNTAEKMIKKHSSKRIIFLFHWNYELEKYPQPLDRELSHKLIDMGVYAVIGCHSHRVQPVEIYKGHIIAYSMGNFAFCQNKYVNGTLSFPDFSLKEIAIELKKEGFSVHHFNYHRKEQSIAYIGESISSESELDGMSSLEYNDFFKKNRYQRKLLPIFYYEDSQWVYSMKVWFVRVRMKMLYLLMNNKKMLAFARNIFK